MFRRNSTAVELDTRKLAAMAPAPQTIYSDSDSDNDPTLIED